MKKIVTSLWFQLSSGIASILGFYFGVSNNIYFNIIISLGVINSILLYNFYNKFKNKHKYAFKKSIEIFSQLAEMHKQNIARLIVKDKEMRKKIKNEKADYEDYLKMLKEIQYDYYNEMSELIKKYIENIINEEGIKEEISVTIKQVFFDDGQTKVVTIWRDRKSFRKNERSIGPDSIANLDDNYDFLFLYRKKRKKCFLENDLKNLKNYENSTTNWQDYYNSTVVVPITLPRNPDGFVGFLCIDCLNKDGENIFSLIHCDILNIFGSLLSEEFMILEKLSKDIIKEYIEQDESETKTLGIIHEIKK